MKTRQNMDLQQIQQLIDSSNISNPQAPEFDDTHVFLLFSDGEINMTKAGGLYGGRSFHMLSPPLKPCDPRIKWPNALGQHPCVIVRDSETAEQLRDALFGGLRKDSDNPLEELAMQREDALKTYFTPPVSGEDFNKMMQASIAPKLVALANKLDEASFHKEADLLDSIILAKKTKEGKEPDVPKKVVEIADAIRRDKPETSDEASYRMAWETYCSYVNPSYEGCTSKGKSHRESPKSEYAKD